MDGKSPIERDTGQKLDAYRAIASVEEYWIVYPGEVRVTRYYRKEDGWGFESYVSLEPTIESERLQVAVPLEEIYRGIL